MAWVCSERGWTINLDGSDASQKKGLPRLEITCGPDNQWTSLCILPDNSCRMRTGGMRTREAAQRAAIEEALTVLGSEYRPLLEQLLARVA